MQEPKAELRIGEIEFLELVVVDHRGLDIARAAHRHQAPPVRREKADLAKERARLAKDAAAIASELDKIAKKLGNEQFMAKAKPEAIEEQRERQAEHQATLAKLNAAIARIGA